MANAIESSEKEYTVGSLIENFWRESAFEDQYVADKAAL
jgi:hypothetical protein